MRLTRMAAMMMAAMVTTVAANARNVDTGAAHDLTIYVECRIIGPLTRLSMAEGLASKMLRTAGVRVKWVHGPPPGGEARPEGSMVITFKSDSPDPRHARSFAFATPYEGSGITVLYSRLQWIESYPLLGYKLLAHVLVHEIAHNLQGVCRHSESGIMKAKWTTLDFQDMGTKPLAFEPVDLHLIEAGFAARAVARARQ
jgi:hypothetical protein